VRSRHRLYRSHAAALGVALLGLRITVGQIATLVMIAYPMLAHTLGLDERAAGVFLGATIHDVAQVVGAGYSMSRETGDIATFVKLLRVAMLLPVIMLAVAVTRARRAADGSGKRPPLLPWFVLAFAALVLVNSLGWIPRDLAAAGVSSSSWCLVASMAAIGMKTQLKELATVGMKPMALMVGETIFLAALLIALMRWAA
jgi:uncharacterized integral membrane protein (TIGR00698 family)